VIRLVRDGGKGHALSAEDRQWLLQSAEAFRDTVQAARTWDSAARSPDAVRPVQRDPAVSLRLSSALAPR
jgi:hypothetical protein